MWLTACATNPASGPQIDLSIRVNNNLIPPTSLTIYLVPRAGIERNLGSIVGSGRHTLNYRGLRLSGEYQLVARTSRDTSMGSPIMVLDNVTGIDWDLQRNYVTLKTADD